MIETLSDITLDGISAFSNNASFLNGQPGSYYLNANNLTGIVPYAAMSGSYNITVQNSFQLNGQTASFYANAGNLTTGTLPEARLVGFYNISVASATYFGGQTSGYYTNASNISTGTLGTGRLSGTYNITANNATNLNGQAASYYLDRTNHTGTQAISTITGLQTALDGKQANGSYVLQSTSLTAGNGMTGGGDWSTSRTITLGTPAAVTLSSTNTVGASNHTHAFTPGGTSGQYIRGDGVLAAFPSIPSGTVTSIVAGNGLDFTTITTSGSVILGTPGAISTSSTNSVSSTSHTHSLDSSVLNRANHTGTQAVGTITGLSNSATITASTSGGVDTIVLRNAVGSIFSRGMTIQASAGSNHGIFFGGGGSHFLRRNDSTNIFNFSHEVTAPVFTPTCDEQTKKDKIRLYSAGSFLPQVNDIELWEYTRISDDIRTFGVMAQQLKTINPLLVSGGAALDPNGGNDNLDGCVVDEDGVTLRNPYGLDIVASLTLAYGAIQDLSQINEDLQAQINQQAEELAAIKTHLGL